MSTVFVVIGIICVFAAMLQLFQEFFMAIMRYFDKEPREEPIEKQHRRLRHQGKQPAGHKRVRLFHTKPLRQ